jgi:phage-related protein
MMKTDSPDFILTVRFYKTDAGIEPVREWLKALPQDYKKVIGEDIKTVQYGWPVGMPIVRKLDKSLWEVRSHLRDGIARVVFTVCGETMVLLHGFIKKSQKTPSDDLETARKRKKNIS